MSSKYDNDRDINGIIVINKERGYTSFDVVGKLRKIIGVRRIGHTGTLDPMATGVLPIAVGSATRLVEMLTGKSKEYIAEMVLGTTTDTYDSTGEVTGVRPVNCSEAEVEAAVISFIGDIEQVPPMYSAVKVNGKKLYELAREGKEIERKSRPVTINHIEILDMQLPKLTIKVSCSKGTYIRSLIYDIGEKLGSGAHMSSLVRTATGDYSLEDCHTLGEVEAMEAEGRLGEAIIPADSFFAHLPKVNISGELLRLTLNGNPISKRDMAERLAKGLNGEDIVSAPKRPERVRIYDDTGRFIAVYYYNKDKYRYAAEYMFAKQ